MTQAVTDDVAAMFCARGRHDEIAPAMKAHFGGLVDVLGVDPTVPAETIAEIQAI